MMTNDICSYIDTSLKGEMNNWYLDGVTGTVITYDGRLDGQPAGSDSGDEGEGGSNSGN